MKRFERYFDAVTRFLGVIGILSGMGAGLVGAYDRGTWSLAVGFMALYLGGWRPVVRTDEPNITVYRDSVGGPWKVTRR